MPTNSAAWLKAKFERFEVSDAPYTRPQGHELVVRNHAVAINPVDRLKQDLGDFLYGWIKYPAILGIDLAGEVVEVGGAVTRFKPGDRVLAHAVGIEKSRNRNAESAFQNYTVVQDHMAAPIPASLRYESASVLPLGISTAACGLFQKDHLALKYPSVIPRETGETVLIWGGSTSVGSNAIQLAKAAGYKVVSTASPHNFDYVRRLGADSVFDYRDGNIVQELRTALQNEVVAGALAIGAGSAGRCIEVLKQCRGNKFVSIASPISLDGLPGRPGFASIIARLAPRLISSVLEQRLGARLGGVRTRIIWGSSLMDNEVSKVIYEDYLPKALAAGVHRAAPDPWVVGEGLHAIQPAFDLQKKGVSAKKIVVKI